MNDELASRHEVNEALDVFDGWLFRLMSAYKDRWGYVPRGFEDFDRAKLEIVISEASSRRRAPAGSDTRSEGRPKERS